MVGSWGLEPQTSTVSRWRSNQLSYEPNEVTRQDLQLDILFRFSGPGTVEGPVVMTDPVA
jgi:hypothetical protein